MKRKAILRKMSSMAALLVFPDMVLNGTDISFLCFLASKKASRLIYGEIAADF